MHIKRFVNYNKFCLFISQLAHDYDNIGFEKFMNKEYNCHGIYKRYLLGYRDYLKHKETGEVSEIKEYKGKFVLEPGLYYDYFKFKNKSIIEDVKDQIVPELYNYGLIFTSVQKSVKSFVKGSKYEKGF